MYFDISVQHRITLAAVLEHYSDAKAAFSAGDFTAAYRLAQDDPVTKAQAAVLCGLAEETLALTESPAIPSSAPYRDLAQWIAHNRNTKPLRVALVGTVSLQILPYFKRAKDFEVITAGYADHYDVRLNIEDSAQALQAKLGPLDFAISLGAEEFSLPSHYAQLPCPKLALFLDSDLTLTSKHAQMQHMNALITFSSTDHFEVRQMYGKPTFTLPCFTYTPDAVKVAAAHRHSPKQKTSDILFTGYARDPFFQRKAQFLFQLAMLPDDVDVIINHNTYRLSLGEYLDRLASAYLVPTFIRWQGAMNTRAMEALAIGARVLVQDGSYMCDFLGTEEAGLHRYRYDHFDDDITAALACAKAHPEPVSYQQLDRLFEPQRMADYFLKSCAFLCRHHLPKTQSDTPPAVLASSGMAFENESDRQGFNRQIIVHTQQNPSLQQHINAVVAASYNITLAADTTKTQAIQEAITTSEQAITKHPDSLLLHFHAARIHFHHGTPIQAVPHLDRIIADYHTLTYHPIHHDIGNGMLLHNAHFPYMHYLDTIITHQLKHKDPAPQTRRTIASAALSYRALIAYPTDPTTAIQIIQQALALDPANWCAHATAVDILADQPEQQAQLLASYRQAVKGFPFLIHDLLVPALNAHRQLKQDAQAKTLIYTWFRFYRRMRYNFECLPLPDAILAHYQNHADHFPKSAHTLFQLLNQIKQTPTWQSIPPLEPFLADVLCANLKARYQHDFQPTDTPPNRRDLAPLLLYAAQCATYQQDASKITQLLNTYFAAKPALPELTKILEIVRQMRTFAAQTAIEHYHQLLEQGFDRDWLLHYEIAECLEQQDNPQAALTHLDFALKSFPDFIKAQKERATLLSQSKTK